LRNRATPIILRKNVQNKTISKIYSSQMLLIGDNLPSMLALLVSHTILNSGFSSWKNLLAFLISSNTLSWRRKGKKGDNTKL